MSVIRHESLVMFTDVDDRSQTRRHFRPFRGGKIDRRARAAGERARCRWS